VTITLARSLFARTAWLIAGTLAVFALIAWAAIAWTTVIPAADMTGHMLAQKADAAIRAFHDGAAVPSDVDVRPLSPGPPRIRPLDAPYSLYLVHLRKGLIAELPDEQVVITRTVMPTEVWVHSPRVPGRWFVLHWRVSRPTAPLALFGVVLAAALLVLVGAAVFARRMTAPLANLVAATEQVAVGERVRVATNSGPSEVRSLAQAFQSMSNRLAELDEQRELMLAGLSHDLRSPLARVRVAVELLEEPNIALGRGMAEEIELIDRMIGQFLHYVRAGYQEQPTWVSPDESVKASLAPFQVGEALRLELNAPETCWIAADSLRHMVVNLVQNACEYGQPPVVVRTALAADQLQISVTDRGPGLSPAEWQDAVRPFQRVRGTPGTGHSGLGLALVERLTQVCKGSLRSRQTAEGFVVEASLACRRE
jgi:two-component system, OmpR family, osmolarity sensor histidine kinase EnvZ